VPDPNKTCPLCGSLLKTTNSIYGGGFRTARRACSGKDCPYSAVLASFIVSTRDGSSTQGPGYVRVAKDIQAGRLRIEYERPF
jgi:hypothetical protein